MKSTPGIISIMGLLYCNTVVLFSSRKGFLTDILGVLKIGGARLQLLCVCVMMALLWIIKY